MVKIHSGQTFCLHLHRRQRNYASPKCWSSPITVYSVIAQNITIWNGVSTIKKLTYTEEHGKITVTK
jgi:hypothetical protein